MLTQKHLFKNALALLFLLPMVVPVCAQSPAAAPADVAAKSALQIDRFGQTIDSHFPEKITSGADLTNDVAADRKYYASLTPPKRDIYGGLPNSRAAYGLKRTGYFHVQQVKGRWALVDPDGNLFFQLGICELGLGDDYTYVAGRHGIYSWLPSKDDPKFKSAFLPNSNGDDFSFYIANIIRKYNRPYDPDTYSQRMLNRVRKWGFNSGGPFSEQTPSLRKSNLPWVAILPLSTGIKFLPGVDGTFDPFDEHNRAAVEHNLAASLPARANDPVLLGYFLSNEPLYEDVPHVVPRLNRKYACKRKLVALLKSKYITIARFNQAWSMKAPSFEALNDLPLPMTTAVANADVHDFTKAFFTAYYKLIADTFHKYDSHHMLIGNRFQAGTINNEQLCRIAGKYLDIMSFNYYTYGLDMAFLKKIYGWTKRPMILSEFYYDAPAASGLSGGILDMTTQAARGLAYRNYVENAAASGFIVGTEWFTLVDQAATGRWFQKYDGEHANSGLFSVGDRPWKDMVAEMAKTNYGIYAVSTGKQKPYTSDDPRFAQPTGQQSMSIPRAAGPVAMDGTAAGFPGVPSETLSGKRLVEGADSGGVEGDFKLCWDDQNLYLLIHVTDPTPMRNIYTGSSIWMADGIELFVGPDKASTQGQFLSTDKQILLSAGTVDHQNPWYVVQNREQKGIRTNVVPNPDGKGYALEAAISFDTLGFTPHAGQTIRFDISIDDSEDGKRRVRQFVWSGTARDSSDRTGWGQARFSE